MTVFQFIATILASIMGSSGIWAFLQWWMSRKDSRGKLLLGLAHTEIVNMCTEFLKWGEITADEYENLRYLYDPYVECGGNHMAKKLMERVDREVKIVHDVSCLTNERH